MVALRREQADIRTKPPKQLRNGDSAHRRSAVVDERTALGQCSPDGRQRVVSRVVEDHVSTGAGWTRSRAIQTRPAGSSGGWSEDSNGRRPAATPEAEDEPLGGYILDAGDHLDIVDDRSTASTTAYRSAVVLREAATRASRRRP